MIFSAFKRAWLVGVAVIALASATSASAHPREGRLDPAYGKGGVAMTSPLFYGDEPDVELTAEGKSVVVADGVEGAAVRFRPNGSWDRNFGQGGLLTIRPATALGGDEDLKFFPDSITVDHRGRVLAFGSRLDTSRTAQGPEGSSVSASLAAVLRYQADGQLDPSFGQGKGYVIGHFGIAPESSTHLPRIGALTGLVDAENRPLLVLADDGLVGGCYGKGGVESVPRALVRLTAAGRPDRGFGDGDGVSRLDRYGAGESLALGLDGHGRPALGTDNSGSYPANCGEGGIVYRFRGDGEPISGFGPHGMRAFEVGHLAVVEPSGATILAEPRGRTLEVLRVRPDGVRDKSFGRSGVAHIHLPPAAASHVEPVAVDGHGRILLAGYVESPGTFVVGRLLPDGRLDRSFGKQGWILTRLRRQLQLTYTNATMDSEGRLLVAGIVRKPGQDRGAFAVARYLLGR